MSKKVSIVHVDNKIYNAVKKMMDELDYKPKKKKILLKPNLAGSFKKKSPFSTSTSLMAALIKYFKNQGYKDIVVAEGTGNDFTNWAFYMGDYFKLQRKKGMFFITKDLNREETEKVNGIFIPKLIKEYEYINVAKMKTHMQTDVTLCIKNQKGLIPVWQKRGFHKQKRFHETIHHNISHLYKEIKPDLSIIDALSGIEGNGPVMGNEVKNLNLLIGGYNAVDVDSVGSMIMGYDPSKIRHIELSRKISKHKVILDEDIKAKINKYKRNFKRPNRVQQILRLRWLYGEETCSGCIQTIFELKQSFIRNFFKRPFKTIKIGLLAVFFGLDILTGNAKVPKRRGLVVVACGHCGDRFKNIKGIKYVKGCPPKGKDLYEAI